MPRGEKGRRLVSYSIGKGLKWVAVSSFPLNLYEKRKQMRKGDAKRKGILLKKFSSGLSGRISTLQSDVAEYIIDDWFNDRKKGGIRRI
jgi:hypothetical protein